jgi:hypothetical protein
MNLLECIFTANNCYKKGEIIKPKGVMVHSTGANNKTLRRYVQPLKTDANCSDMVAKLGKNIFGNHWNKSGLSVCVHAFIGTLKDGSVATVQTLPWDRRGWHSAKGSKGSANDTHISFEICEDNTRGADYFQKVYKEAVELTAMLCKKYNLDPLADGVVICHSEGYKRGIASNHSDVMHWFPKHGKSMDSFRKDVAKAMGAEEKESDTVKLDYARSFNKAYNKSYKVTANSGLNMRCGAGTNKKIITALKNGTKFRCYGYYTKQSDGTIWLYGAANGETGYCSKAYLK